jgi:hypothetical protein
MIWINLAVGDIFVIQKLNLKNHTIHQYHKPYLMKKALITLIFPLFTLAGTLPLIFLTTKPNHQKSLLSRYRMVDQLTLLYTENTIKKLEENASYTLSFRVENQIVTDTIQLKKPENNHCIFNGRLFTMSSLKADNESNRSFKNNTVVDVYLLTNNSYEGSFYIPNARDKKIIAIRLLNGFLIAFYQDSFSIYSLPVNSNLPKADNLLSTRKSFR